MDVRRFVLAGAVIALAATVTTACSSSSSKSTPSSNKPAASTTGSSTPTGSSASTGTSTPSGTPIKIGNIGSYSGTQASSIAGAEQVLKAWAQSVNAAGGINGHPVDLIVKDLGTNVTGGLAAAKELVEQDKVVAIVGEQDNADTTWSQYVATKGVPVIGGLSINIPFATNPDFFPAGSNVFALIYGELVAAKKLGGPFDYLYCAEAPQCASSVPLVQSIAKIVGVKVPLAVKVVATAPDYTALCQQIKQTHATSYAVGSASAVIVRVATECAGAGVTAKQVSTDGTATASWATVKALAGASISEADFPFVGTASAGPAAYQALLAKYLPKLGAANGPAAAYSFVAGRLFEKAAQGAGATVTAASLKTALYAMKGETLEGLAPPLTFVSGKPTEVNCFFTMGLSGGKFTDPDPGKTACAPDALVSGIVTQLTKSGS